MACSGGALNVLSQSHENLNIGTGFVVGETRNVICPVWPAEEMAASPESEAMDLTADI